MSLYANINKRKKSGKSRTKKKSTISSKAYRFMQAGWIGLAYGIWTLLKKED